MATPINFDNTPNVEFKQANPKPVPAEEEKKVYTAEEVEEMAQAAMKSFGWEGPLPKKENKDEKPLAEGDAPDPAKAISTPENDPAKETEKKPVKKPVPPKPKDEDMADKIGSRIAAENEKLLARIQKPDNSRQEKPTQHVELSEKESEDNHLREVFATMASMNPYNTELPKQFETFLKAESAYQTQWQKENPGEKFNADDHADWYEKNQPDYDTRQFNRAEAHLEAKALLNQERTSERSKQATESAVALAESSIESSTEALESDVKKHIEGILGENQVMDTEGPIAEKYQSVSSNLADKITTASVLMTPGTGVVFNANDKMHVAIRSDILEFNSDIESLSESEQKDLVSKALGKKSRLITKKFIPIAEYQKLSPEERAKHWNIASEPALAAKLMTVKAKTEMMGWLDKLFNQVSRKSEKSTAEEVTPRSESKPLIAHNTSAGKPSPPSLGNGATDVTPQNGAKVKSDNSWESIANSF